MENQPHETRERRVFNPMTYPGDPYVWGMFAFFITLFLFWFPVRWLGQWAFHSNLLSVVVPATVKHAEVIGVLSRGHSDVDGTDSRPPYWYDMTLEYRYKGKTYVSRTPALGKCYIPVLDAKTRKVKRYFFKPEDIRGYAPNTAFTYKRLGSKEDDRSYEEKFAFLAGLDPGRENVEIQIPVLRMYPAWNYFNVMIPRVWSISQVFIYGLGAGWPLIFIFTYLKRVGEAQQAVVPLLMRAWPHCLVGIALGCLLMTWVRTGFTGKPSEAEIAEAIESSHFPSLKPAPPP
jgi:hypothetical protein